jgi:hypothetical protein
VQNCIDVRLKRDDDAMGARVCFEDQRRYNGRPGLGRERGSRKEQEKGKRPLASQKTEGKRGPLAKPSATPVC